MRVEKVRNIFYKNSERNIEIQGEYIGFLEKWKYLVPTFLGRNYFYLNILLLPCFNKMSRPTKRMFSILIYHYFHCFPQSITVHLCLKHHLLREQSLCGVAGSEASLELTITTLYKHRYICTVTVHLYSWCPVQTGGRQ